jgi:hypothetical protein
MHEIGVPLHPVFGVAAYVIHCLLADVVSVSNCPSFAVND